MMNALKAQYVQYDISEIENKLSRLEKDREVLDSREKRLLGLLKAKRAYLDELENPEKKKKKEAV